MSKISEVFNPLSTWQKSEVFKPLIKGKAKLPGVGRQRSRCLGLLISARLHPLLTVYMLYAVLTQRILT